MGVFGTMWNIANILKHCGILWNIVEHFGTFWNILENFGSGVVKWKGGKKKGKKKRRERMGKGGGEEERREGKKGRNMYDRLNNIPHFIQTEKYGRGPCEPSLTSYHAHHS